MTTENGSAEQGKSRLFACIAQVENEERCQEYILEQGGFCNTHNKESLQVGLPDIVILRIPILWNQEKFTGSIPTIQPDWEERAKNAQLMQSISITNSGMEGVSLQRLPAELAAAHFRATRVQLEPGSNGTLYLLVYFSTVSKFEEVQLTRTVRDALGRFMSRKLGSVRVFVSGRKPSGWTYHVVTGFLKGRREDCRYALELNNGLWRFELIESTALTKA